MNSTNFSEKIDWYILSNGINDELLSVFEWAKKTYSNDVNWNIDINEINVGVGAGINQLHTKALHYEYIFFLEGDWVSLPPHVSGHSNNWLHNSIKLLDENLSLDQIQFRRYLDDLDERQYGYEYWIRSENIKEIVNNGDAFMILHYRSYQNPPCLYRTKSLFDKQVFPLTEYFDENGIPLEIKGNPEWGKAEMAADDIKTVQTAWLYLGNFVHCDSWYYDENWDLLKEDNFGCGKYPHGVSSCKYGYIFPGHYFCSVCSVTQSIHDLYNHNETFVDNVIPLLETDMSKDEILKELKPIITNPTINSAEYINHEMYKNKKMNRGESHIQKN